MADTFELIEECILVSGDDRCPKNEMAVICDCKPNSNGLMCLTTKCPNFQRQAECITCKPQCANNKMTLKKYAKIAVTDTVGKGKGLFAAENIVSGAFVRDYVGEIIDGNTYAERRSSQAHNKHLFLAYLKEETWLDSTHKANISRYINHSCDPNCRFETWSVNNHLRIGIFASKNVMEGEELTFDYRWDYSSDRQPTKCLCGTAKCRGYLEVLNEQQLKELSLLRKGVWKSRNELPIEALIMPLASVESESIHHIAPNLAASTIDPNWLIGKRVKVWWPGNLAFFEADIEEFTATKGSHTLRYIADGQTTEEQLILKPTAPRLYVSGHESASAGTAATVGAGAGVSPLRSRNDAVVVSDWMWLDETAEEISISKKVIDKSLDEVVVLLVDSNADSSSGGNQLPEEQSGAPAFVPIAAAKVTVEVSLTVARKIVNRYFQTILEVNRLASKSIYELSTQIALAISAEFNISCTAQNWTENDATNSQTIDWQLLLSGDGKRVSTASDFINKMIIQNREEQNNLEEILLKQLNEAQLCVCTGDWRVLSFDVLKTLQAPSYQVGLNSLVLSLSNRIGFVSHSLIANCAVAAHQKPSVSTSGAIPNSVHFLRVGYGYFWSRLTDATKQQYCSMLVMCVAMLSFGNNISIHAISILVRYLIAVSDVNVSDMTTLLAACICIALKAKKLFKNKLLRKIVHKCYILVYNREDTPIESVPTALITRVVDKEQQILAALGFDVFVFDISDIFQSICLLKNALAKKERLQHYYQHQHQSSSQGKSSRSTSASSATTAKLSPELKRKSVDGDSPLFSELSAQPMKRQLSEEQKQQQLQASPVKQRSSADTHGIVSPKRKDPHKSQHQSSSQSHSHSHSHSHPSPHTSSSSSSKEELRRKLVAIDHALQCSTIALERTFSLVVLIAKCHLNYFASVLLEYIELGCLLMQYLLPSIRQYTDNVLLYASKQQSPPNGDQLLSPPPEFVYVVNEICSEIFGLDKYRIVQMIQFISQLLQDIPSDEWGWLTSSTSKRQPASSAPVVASSSSFTSPSAGSAHANSSLQQQFYQWAVLSPMLAQVWVMYCSGGAQVGPSVVPELVRSKLDDMLLQLVQGTQHDPIDISATSPTETVLCPRSIVEAAHTECIMKQLQAQRQQQLQDQIAVLRSLAAPSSLRSRLPWFVSNNNSNANSNGDWVSAAAVSATAGGSGSHSRGSANSALTSKITLSGSAVSVISVVNKDYVNVQLPLSKLNISKHLIESTLRSICSIADSESDNNNNSSDQMLSIGLRVWPTTKQQQREILRQQMASSSDSSLAEGSFGGISAAALSELAILQQLQYAPLPTNSSAGKTEHEQRALNLSPHFPLPMAILQIDDLVIPETQRRHSSSSGGKGTEAEEGDEEAEYHKLEALIQQAMSRSGAASGSTAASASASASGLAAEDLDLLMQHSEDDNDEELDSSNSNKLDRLNEEVDSLFASISGGTAVVPTAASTAASASPAAPLAVPTLKYYILCPKLLLPLKHYIRIISKCHHNHSNSSSSSSSCASPSSSNAGDLVVHRDSLLLLCQDMLAAFAHCVKCGVYIKWLSLDALSLSLDGTLVISSLDGAISSSSEPITIASNGSSSANNNTSEHHRSDGHGALATSSHPHKKSKSAVQQTNLNNLKSQIPSSSMETAAPEIVFGSSPTPASTAYTAAIACSYILAGRVPIKSSSSEEKYVQHIYRSLGTPKFMQCLEEFAELPQFAIFGRQIKGEKGELTEAKARVGKVMSALLPAHLQGTRQALVEGAAGASTATAAITGQSVEDLFVSLLTLSPSTRSPLPTALSFQCFADLPQHHLEVRYSGLKLFHHLAKAQQRKATASPSSASPSSSLSTAGVDIRPELMQAINNSIHALKEYLRRSQKPQQQPVSQPQPQTPRPPRPPQQQQQQQHQSTQPSQPAWQPSPPPPPPPPLPLPPLQPPQQQRQQWPLQGQQAPHAQSSPLQNQQFQHHSRYQSPQEKYNPVNEQHNPQQHHQSQQQSLSGISHRSNNANREN